MAWPGKQWTRDGRALLAAALLHALSLTALRHFDAPSADPTPRAATKVLPEEQQYELDLSAPSSEAQFANAPVAAEDVRVNEEPIRSTTGHAGPRSAHASRVASNDANAGVTENPEPTIAADASNATIAAEDSSEAPAGDAPVEHIDLGLGPEGWRRWATNRTAGAPESEATPGREPRFKAPAKSNTGGLLEGLEEHDRAVGLTPSGRVRSALFNAAHSDVAPQLGVASFRVTVRNDGSVEVAVHGATDSEQQWQKVAERAAADLRKNPPRIPPPRTGARMLVEIKAESVLPNGAKVANLHGTRIEVDPPRIRSLEESKKALKDKNPTAEALTGPDYTPPLAVDVPGVYLTHAGKVCTVRVGITPFGLALGGGCDPSNIGAKQARMVHTRIREESLF